jgi:DNA/RNA-binding domain of Phe-tRNA-synthetase-like protein
MPAAPTLTIDAELASKVRLGVLVLDGLTVRDADASLSEEIERACQSFRERHGDAPSGSVPGVEEARRLYKALGIDPTKTRPSNEALLRRALKGEALYRINTLVDAVNLCSLVQQLPYGLYDLARIVPPVTLRRGRPGEGYEGIRKGFVNVAGRPTLVDEAGAFGNPTSDSARTSISLAARSVLVVAYAPRDLTKERMERILSETAATVMRHCGGAVLARLDLPE